MYAVLPAHAATTWRLNLVLRLLCGLIALMFISLIPTTIDQVFSSCSGDACWAGDGRWWSLIVGVPAILVGAPFAVSVAFTMARLESERLVVRRAWWRETAVPLAEITEVDADRYLGVRVARENGRAVQIWALQKSNLAVMLNRETRADRAATAIREAAEKARAAKSSV